MHWFRSSLGLNRGLAHTNHPGKPIIWLHYACPEDLEIIKPLVEAYRQSHPNYRVVISAPHRIGISGTKGFVSPDDFFHLPADNPKNAKRILEDVNPRIAVFVGCNPLPHCLTLLNSMRIPSIAMGIGGRITPSLLPGNSKGEGHPLSLYSHILVESEQERESLWSAGLTQALAVGNLRFDRAWEFATSSSELPILSHFSKGFLCLVAGFTNQLDEELITQYINQSGGCVKLLIAPAIATSRAVKGFQSSIGEPSILYSAVRDQNLLDYQVLILDSKELAPYAFRHASIAYVGGGAGEQTALEAAAFGVPVILSPHHKGAPVTDQLVAMQAGFTPNDSEGFLRLMNNLVTNHSLRCGAGDSAREYVGRNIGSTQKSIDLLKRLAEV